MRRRIETYRDDRGSITPYFAIIAATLVGFAGLSVDVGRFLTTNTQAKAAADGAALAGAIALAAAVRAPGADPDNPAPVLAAIELAARTGVSNRQNFAATTPGGTNMGGTVQITGVRLLTSLPELNGGSSSGPVDAYVTADPWQAHFVEVTTETLSQTNFLLPAIGASRTDTTRALAIAGVTQVLCNVPPLWICNPNETSGAGLPFDSPHWRGREALLKASGPNTAWAPGNFGLLDSPNGQGANAVANFLGAAAPNACFKSDGADLRPGQAASVRTGLNTRFDIYENPHFGSAQDARNPDYRPAKNVTKGRIWTGHGGNTCSSYTEPGPPTAMGLPRDPDLSITNRFGNGQWDCAQYWSINHPGLTPPAGCTNPSAMSRYAMYRHEIDNALIPNNGPAGENGNPQCYRGPLPIPDTPDRRILYVAIINCAEQALNGNRDGVPVAAFAKVFLPEPVAPVPGDEIVIEFVDVVRPGSDDGVLHELVQLYR